MTLNSYLSIVTLNVNGLNNPIKRHRVSDWIKKQDPSISCLQETHLRPKDTYILKIKGWRTIYHSNGPQKKAGVAILISDKLIFTPKTIVREEEGEKGAENLFQEIMAQSFPNEGKEIDLQIQEAQRTPIKINKSRPTPRHIVVQFAKYSDKERILKAAREKKP